MVCLHNVIGFLLYKRTVRIISNAGFLDHTTSLFCNLKLLKFNDLYHLKLDKFMYKYMSNALPPCFSSFFTLTTGIHSYKIEALQRKIFLFLATEPQCIKTALFNAVLHTGIIWMVLLNLQSLYLYSQKN